MKNKRRMILLCVFALFFAFLFVTVKNDKKSISSLADETLDFLESVCKRYDGYTVGNSAEMLKEVYDKANSLTGYTSASSITDEEFLLDYVDKMDLSGVLVLDEKAHLAARADKEGKNLYPIWERFLENENKLEIIQHPNKTFCAKLTAYNKEYAVAIVSRQDTEGLVLCYKETAFAQTDLYETSLDKTLTNNTFHKNPRIVITDRDAVVASNNDFLPVGTDISEEPLAKFDSKDWANGRLIRIVWRNGFWYGKREAYGRYLIYVFYPASEIFVNLLPYAAIFIAGCALLLVVFVRIRSISERVHREREREQEEAYKEKLRKTARDAMIANAAKTSFLRRMSHDIRTPINGIRGMAVLAQNSLENPEKANDCIEKIIVSSNYLQELLDDILRLSKLESGKTFFEEKSFDLQKLIGDTKRFMEAQANEKQVQFSFDTSEIAHPYVIASPMHLRQVMQNILNNAVKFNRVGGRVDVICKESAHPDPKKVWFEFICSDTGIGIGEEFQKDIFEPFSQERDGARTSYEGAGLGLPIVKEILEQRGGSISFTSEKNVGTTFHVKVPLTIDQDAEARAKKTHDAGNNDQNDENNDNSDNNGNKKISLEGIRVLIAEDNAINMEIAKELLEQSGAVTIPAADGQEAIDLFAKTQPDTVDVILMDIMMPRVNGLDAAKAIRAMDRSDAATIPIFAMTANAFVEDVQSSRAAGMNEHLSKPLDMDQVIRLISRYCQGKKEKGSRLQK